MDDSKILMELEKAFAVDFGRRRMMSPYKNKKQWRLPAQQLSPLSTPSKYSRSLRTAGGMGDAVKKNLSPLNMADIRRGQAIRSRGGARGRGSDLQVGRRARLRRQGMMGTRANMRSKNAFGEYDDEDMEFGRYDDDEDMDFGRRKRRIRRRSPGRRKRSPGRRRRRSPGRSPGRRRKRGEKGKCNPKITRRQLNDYLLLNRVPQNVIDDLKFNKTKLYANKPKKVLVSCKTFEKNVREYFNMKGIFFPSAYILDPSKTKRAPAPTYRGAAANVIADRFRAQLAGRAARGPRAPPGATGPDLSTIPRPRFAIPAPTARGRADSLPSTSVLLPADFRRGRGVQERRGGGGDAFFEVLNQPLASRVQTPEQAERVRLARIQSARRASLAGKTRAPVEFGRKLRYGKMHRKKTR